MRLTRAGIALAIAAVGLLVAARAFGIVELYYLSAMAIVALILAAIYTATSRISLSVGRVATPARLRAGTPARVDLALRNRTKRSTPVIMAHDHVEGGRGASVLLAPIRPDHEARIAYRLPTRRRGALQVGPLDLGLGDPLGLTKTTLQAAERTTLMIHARVVDLGPLLAAAGHDPTAEQQPIRALANAGDEFFALRPYVVGDELKRVNWRASARSEELVVRQEEKPRTGRVTIILDLRKEVYDEDSFERAVSAALSALHSAFLGGDALRFITSAGNAVSDIRTRHELDAVDEQLALIDTTVGASLANTLERVSRGRTGGTLVVVTGVVNDTLEPIVSQAYRSFGKVTVIACQGQGDPTPAWALPYTDETDLARGWAHAMKTG